MVGFNEKVPLENFYSCEVIGDANNAYGGGSSRDKPKRQEEEDKPKRQEEDDAHQKVSTVEEGKPSIQVLDDVSQMVSNEGNTNSSEHQADIKERQSPGKGVSESSDSVVELEKVKKEMISMKTALLGAARQTQEAEAKAAGAEERERAVNQRLSQTLSRINVLEAQIRDLDQTLNIAIIPVHFTTIYELTETPRINQQEVSDREHMLRRNFEDLQQQYQELVTQVSESTRPLLRQIEAIQEITATKERSLNSQLQEAEAKASGAEQREGAVNERLSQTLSRINVLEAQISCLRTEGTQLSKSLEKERQKASESKQDYLALKEKADTHEGRANQLQEEIQELKQKHKQELHEALIHRELVLQDLEREKAACLELEKATHLSSAVPEQNPKARTKSAFENERQNPGEPTLSSYHLKSKTPNAYEAALRRKEGELDSYMSRLGSMESIRDSLAEELVKMTGECEKLRSEVSQLPVIKAELDALRQRHSTALELMGERDEELEQLRADIVDLKEIYREQVNILVNKGSGSSVAVT